jgi:hypothetical protein
MLRELIETPIRLTIAAIGGVAGAVASRIGGDRSGPPASRDEREAVRGRDAHASDWDERAPVPPGGSSPDDLVIADRVKSEVLGIAEAPKGEINLNVENGVVILRGHLADPEQIDELVTLAGAVEGVVGVENLIAS